MRDLLGVYNDGDKWDQNQNIVIKFMSEGPMWISGEYTTGKVYATGPDMRAVFEELITQEFAPHVNLTFTFIGEKDPRKGDVRVLFHEKCERDGGRNESYVGKRYPSDESTMDLKRLLEFNEPRSAMIATMRHEIAHMMGLLHEHQHPLSGIPWKSWYDLSPMAKARYGDPHEYFEQTFNYVPPEHARTSYDPLSITHYSVPRNLVPKDFEHPLKGKESTHLSIEDMKTLRLMYPKETYQHTVEEHHEMNANRFPDLHEDGITSSTPHIEWKEYARWSRLCDRIYPESSTPDDTGTYEGKKNCSVPDYMFRSPGAAFNSGAPEPAPTSTREDPDKENEDDEDEPKVWVIVVIVLSAMLLLSGGFFLWRKYNRKTLVYDPLPTGKRKTTRGRSPGRKRD